VAGLETGKSTEIVAKMEAVIAKRFFEERCYLCGMDGELVSKWYFCPTHIKLYKGKKNA
jgi:hypothetical protein